MTGWSGDLRYAWRQLRKSPGFAATAVLTLVLGIGANTAVFQLLAAVRLRSLPVEKPQELAEVKIVGGNGGMGLNQKYGELTQPLWREIRERQPAFSAMFAWSADQRYVGQGSAMRPFNGLWVSGDFFRVLGIRPWRGRLLMPEDEAECPVSHAVASYAYWQRELGGRDLSAGIKLIANNDLVEIVGVTPPGFFGMVVGDRFDLAFPFCQPQEGFRRDLFDLSVMGRLKPGWTTARASAAMDALSPGVFEATVPPERDSNAIDSYQHFRLAAYPASTGVSSLREYDRSLVLLLAITSLVLLIACANLANLMLVRASARRAELALRLALGASRSRLLRQLLVESALVTVAGAVLGLVLAPSLSRVLVWSISTESAPINLPLVTDWRLLMYAISVAAFTGVIFGGLPAFEATRRDPLSAMKPGGRETAGRARFRFQQALVVTQMSISLVLLVGALLFVRSFRNLITFNPGMRESGMRVAFLGFWQSHLPRERWLAFEQELLEELRSLPGVMNAATTTHAPLLGGSWEHAVHVGASEGYSKFTWVSPEFFKTMDIPILRGRSLLPQDTASSSRVALVNETFVRHFLNGVNPIGQILRTSPEPDYPATVYEIVGIIPDTRYNDLRSETPPMTFAPISQLPAPQPWARVMIRSDLPAATLDAAIRQAVAEKHPETLVQCFDFQTLVRDGLIQERLMALLSGSFGVLAVLLTAVGLYGVISYIVLLRRKEIGIRMALGASRGSLIREILLQTSVLLIVGLAIGAGVALVAGQSARSLVFGMQPGDLLTFAGAGALLIAFALLASFLPAQRASRIDPMVALRYE